MPFAENHSHNHHHESTKGRSHEREPDCLFFVLSNFRVFVIDAFDFSWMFSVGSVRDYFRK
jgi:hypothetical protein